MIKVMVADDHDIVRGGIAMILNSQPDIEVVAEAIDGYDAVQQAQAQHELDVVLVDIRMPRMDGIEATRQLAQLPSAPRVLILTTFDVDEYVYDALMAGASGFLLKRSKRERIIDAVRVLAAGEALLAPQITRRLIDRFAATRLDPVAVGQVETLTSREQEVLRLVAQGKSNSEVATDLQLSDHTVKTHVSSILTKCGLRDRIQAVILAYDAGVVTPRPAT